jgi:hypothetical protein
LFAFLQSQFFQSSPQSVYDSYKQLAKIDNADTFRFTLLRLSRRAA